jgi:hypothetical protein
MHPRCEGEVSKAKSAVSCQLSRILTYLTCMLAWWVAVLACTAVRLATSGALSMAWLARITQKPPTSPLFENECIACPLGALLGGGCV